MAVGTPSFAATLHAEGQVSRYRVTASLDAVTLVKYHANRAEVAEPTEPLPTRVTFDQADSAKELVAQVLLTKVK